MAVWPPPPPANATPCSTAHLRVIRRKPSAQQPDAPIGGPAQHSPEAPAPFDFAAPARVVSLPRATGPRSATGARDSAAEAVRFAIEDVPAPLLLGAHLEVDELQFDADGIRALYARADYPLPRADDADETAGSRT